MLECQVTYYLDDSQNQRLEKLREAYVKKGVETTKEGLFESIMHNGATFDVDEKLVYAEYMAGLREHSLTAAEAHKETFDRLKKERKIND